MTHQTRGFNMKTSRILLVTVITVIFLLLIITGCTQNDVTELPDTDTRPVESEQETESGDSGNVVFNPFSVNPSIRGFEESEMTDPAERGSMISISTNYEGNMYATDADGRETDEIEAILFSVAIENSEILGDIVYGVNLHYEALVKTGMESYVREDPSDENSPFISNEHGPVLFNIVEPYVGVIESFGDIRNNVIFFDVPPPDGVVSVNYWAEIVIPGGVETGAIMDIPYVTADQVMLQGGLLGVDEG